MCNSKLMRLTFLDICRLVVGESLKVRRVVPILGVPDALVPLEVPLSQLTLFPGYCCLPPRKKRLNLLYIEIWTKCITLKWLLFCCRETTSIWVSIDVPDTQPPGQYEGEIIITAIRADTEWESNPFTSVNVNCKL